MVQRFICLVVLLFLGMMPFCLNINDCECVVQKDGVRQEVIHNDYDGDCSELNVSKSTEEIVYCQ